MSIEIKDNKLIVLSPVTSNIVGSLKISTDEEVDNALNIAKNYKKWSSLSVNKRCKVINKFRRIVLANSEIIKETIKNETGKKDFVVWVEFFSFLDHAKTMSKIARKGLKRNYRKTGLLFKNKTAYVQYEPLGTVGIIAPWNYPLATPLNSTMEALLAGNNVILKPSEHTPLTSNLLKKLWDENIEYKEAFQIVNGQGDIGSKLVNSILTDIISFTGSTKVGKEIASICSKTLKPCILELGGKDPMIVLKDASLHRSVESALYSGLFNSGQTCISTEEVYVEEDIFDDFVSMISSRINTFSSGGKDNDDLGPIITSDTKNKIDSQINEVKDICNIVSGKNNDNAKYVAPTIVVNPPSSSKIVNEETFGPVMSIRSFNNEDELIEKIHKTGYGLSSSIFGKDKKRIHRIVKMLKTGNVNINDVMTNYGITSLPYGGEGISGLGKQHGIEGLISLSRTKSVVVNKFNFIDEITWWGRSKKLESFLGKITFWLFKLWI